MTYRSIAQPVATAFLCIALISPMASCSRPPEPEKGPRSAGFRQTVDPAVAGVRPEKPLKIKLKRISDGKYSWEITGGNANKIVAADRELRENFNKKQTTIKRRSDAEIFHDRGH